MNKTAIISGVAGGASRTARLRELDEGAVIVMLERGEYTSYANYGLPYHMGDTVELRSAPLLQTPGAMRKKFEVDMKVKNEAVAIDWGKGTILMKRADSGETYGETCDTLVISTGFSLMQPDIPGAESPRIKTLWTVSDTNDIQATIREQGVKTTAMTDDGFIGLEMAENLREAGLEVLLTKAMDRVMTSLDYGMVLLPYKSILQNEVNLYLGDGISSLAERKNQVAVALGNGDRVTMGFVILTISTRPNSELVEEVRLALNERGGVVMGGYLRISDRDICVVGDVIEVEDFVWKEPIMVSLAGLASKQRWIAADSAAGKQEWYQGTQGTSVTKVFDLMAVVTGVNEKTFLRRELARGKDYERILTIQGSHVGYYPGAVSLALELLFPVDRKRIFGVQIVEQDGMDKRIDTIVVAMCLGVGTEALRELKLVYVPPYSSARGPVDMVGLTTENVRAGLVFFTNWNEAERNPAAVALDMQKETGLMTYTIPGARHTPLGQLRSQLRELDQEAEVIIFCAIGVRVYSGARILMQHGFQHVKVYPGGVRFCQSTHYENHVTSILMAVSVSDSSGTMSAPGAEATGTAPDGMRAASASDRTDTVPMQDSTRAISTPSTSDISKVTVHLDYSGPRRPEPVMRVFETMRETGDDDVVRVPTSDPGFARDIDAWCHHTEDVLVSNKRCGNDYMACIRKCTSAPQVVVKNIPRGKIITVFPGGLDRVLASFAAANGAAAVERPVTMFFTFWGLTASRKEKRQPVKEIFMEPIFGVVFSRGSEKLKLSKMNMAGMDTVMMKKIMNDESVGSLKTLIQKVMASGVKIFVCTVSMGAMGIKEEELIDDVELGGVGAYLDDTEGSNVNLFT